MKRMVAPLLMVLSGTAAIAGSTESPLCVQLWYERNKKIAWTGHCFKSEYGQHVFGKRCTRRSVKLNRRDNKIIRQIQALERSSECVYLYMSDEVLDGLRTRWHLEQGWRE